MTDTIEFVEEASSPVSFVTPQKLYEEIEDLVWAEDISYLDAILLYAERNNIEAESLSVLINKNQNLKELLRKDAEDLNFLPKTVRIPGL